MIVMTIFLVNVWFEEGPRGGSPAKDFRRSLTIRFQGGQFCAKQTVRKRGAYPPVLSAVRWVRRAKIILLI